MKTITTADILSWNPCEEKLDLVPKNWSGTALDVLNADHIEIEDRFWVVLRPEILDEKTLRLFAVWCARQVQHLMPEKRCIAALDVAERFANGEATEDELDAAYKSAGAAAWSAAWSAAEEAARDAAWSVAEEAARDAAGAAAAADAGSAAWSAAWSAARDAARASAAAGSAARDAAAAAAGAAAAARAAQLAKLKEMVILTSIYTS